MGRDRASPRRSLRQLWRDRRAATAIEYGLVIALIVLAMMVALTGVANVTTGLWNSISTKVANAR